MKLLVQSQSTLYGIFTFWFMFVVITFMFFFLSANPKGRGKTPCCGTSCHPFVKNKRSVIKTLKVCITLWSLYIFQGGGLKPQFPWKKGLNYLMPVPKENTIDKTWVHNRDVKTSNASSFVPYRKVLSYLKQRSMVLRCNCGANHFVTVLLCIDLWGVLHSSPDTPPL